MKPEDSRSMCPMTSDTKVIVKSNENDVRIAVKMTSLIISL